MRGRSSERAPKARGSNLSREGCAGEGEFEWWGSSSGRAPKAHDSDFSQKQQTLLCDDVIRWQKTRVKSFSKTRVKSFSKLPEKSFSRINFN